MNPQLKDLLELNMRMHDAHVKQISRLSAWLILAFVLQAFAAVGIAILALGAN